MTPARVGLTVLIVSAVVFGVLVFLGLDPVSARCAYKVAPRCVGASDLTECMESRMYCCRYGFDCHWVR